MHRSESGNRVHHPYDDPDRIIRFVNEKQITDMIKQPKGDRT